MKGYECMSCREIVVGEEEPMMCPKCRSRMIAIQDVPQAIAWYTCGECGRKFAVLEKSSPYKCPWCNFTFQRTKYKRAEERL